MIQKKFIMQYFDKTSVQIISKTIQRSSTLLFLIMILVVTQWDKHLKCQFFKESANNVKSRSNNDLHNFINDFPTSDDVINNESEVLMTSLRTVFLLRVLHLLNYFSMSKVKKNSKKTKNHE